MALTPDIERANALVEVAALLLKADNIVRKALPGMQIMVTGFVAAEVGVIKQVRIASFASAVKLEGQGG